MNFLSQLSSRNLARYFQIFVMMGMLVVSIAVLLSPLAILAPFAFGVVCAWGLGSFTNAVCRSASVTPKPDKWRADLSLILAIAGLAAGLAIAPWIAICGSFAGGLGLGRIAAGWS